MNEHKSEFKWVGTRTIRPDGVDKVTGRANFGADHVMPGMLIGKVLRSPHAHAHIIEIDLQAALSMPGVLAIYTAADIRREGLGSIKCMPTGHVRSAKPLGIEAIGGLI